MVKNKLTLVFKRVSCNLSRILSSHCQSSADPLGYSLVCPHNFDNVMAKFAADKLQDTRLKSNVDFGEQRRIPLPAGSSERVWTIDYLGSRAL